MLSSLLELLSNSKSTYFASMNPPNEFLVAGWLGVAYLLLGGRMRFNLVVQHKSKLLRRLRDQIRGCTWHDYKQWLQGFQLFIKNSFQGGDLINLP